MRHLRNLYDLFALSGTGQLRQLCRLVCGSEKGYAVEYQGAAYQDAEDDKAAENAAALKQARSDARSPIQVTATQAGSELSWRSDHRAWRNDRR